jgi:hypothetical protein
MISIVKSEKLSILDLGQAASSVNQVFRLSKGQEKMAICDMFCQVRSDRLKPPKSVPVPRSLTRLCDPGG